MACELLSAVLWAVMAADVNFAEPDGWFAVPDGELPRSLVDCCFVIDAMMRNYRSGVAGALDGFGVFREVLVAVWCYSDGIFQTPPSPFSFNALKTDASFMIFVAWSSFLRRLSLRKGLRDSRNADFALLSGLFIACIIPDTFAIILRSIP